MPPDPPQIGLSFKEYVDELASFLEITLHTILYIRAVYPPTTFARRRAHGVPVYQSRHPQVREYIAEIVGLLRRELDAGNLRRVSVVIKRAIDGLPFERFLIDVAYGDIVAEAAAGAKDVGMLGAPAADELSMMLRGFLIRLLALDGQLGDNKIEMTFAVIVETKDGLEPVSNSATDGNPVPWVPALKADTLHPQAQNEGEDCPAKHEPLLHVKAVETGVIDFRLLVQECYAKTGVPNLSPAQRL